MTYEERMELIKKMDNWHRLQVVKEMLASLQRDEAESAASSSQATGVKNF